MELIDKAAIVDELQKRIRTNYRIIDLDQGNDLDYYLVSVQNYENLLSFINTVEVKEVDCEREIGIYTTKELLKKRNHSTGVFHLTQTDINSIAKHFFELGLKAKKGE